jgi:hypothetical protein
MNLQRKFAVLAILAGFLLGMTHLSAIAFADKPKDPDCWGEESAQQAKSGTQGEHASDPIPGDNDRETPRSGIGNLAPHPSDLGEALNGADNCEPN